MCFYLRLYGSLPIAEAVEGLANRDGPGKAPLLRPDLRAGLRAAPRSRVRTCVRACASRVQTCVRLCAAGFFGPHPPRPPSDQLSRKCEICSEERNPGTGTFGGVKDWRNRDLGLATAGEMAYNWNQPGGFGTSSGQFRDNPPNFCPPWATPRGR